MSAQFKPYADAILRHHDAHERLPALFEVYADLDTESFWKVLYNLLPVTSVFHPHQEIIRRMLSSERINDYARLESWTENDAAWVKRMIARRVRGVDRPKSIKPLKVYRGGSKKFGLTGFNWTTKYDIARWHAERTGFPVAFISVGRLEVKHILIPNADHHAVFAFPEHVEIERYDQVSEIDPLVMKEAQLRAFAGIHGVAEMRDMTPGQALKIEIESGKRDRDKATAQLTQSRQLLEGLGFKKRLVVIDEMLAVISDAVCSAE